MNDSEPPSTGDILARTYTRERDEMVHGIFRASRQQGDLLHAVCDLFSNIKQA